MFKANRSFNLGIRMQYAYYDSQKLDGAFKRDHCQEVEG